MSDDVTVDPAKLRLARLAARLSQRGLARQIGVPAPAIQHLEAGTPIPSLTLQTYLRMTRVLELTFDHLLTPRPVDDPPTRAPAHPERDEPRTGDPAPRRTRPHDHSLIAVIYDNQPITGSTIAGLLGYTASQLDDRLSSAATELDAIGLTLASSRLGYRIETLQPALESAAAAKLAANSFTTRQASLLLTLRNSPGTTRVAYNRNDPNDHYLFRAGLITVEADGKLAPSTAIRWPSDLLNVPPPQTWTRKRGTKQRGQDQRSNSHQTEVRRPRSSGATAPHKQ